MKTFDLTVTFAGEAHLSHEVLSAQCGIADNHGQMVVTTAQEAPTTIEETDPR